MPGTRDRITANLPTRDLDETVAFYGQLGFAVTFRDEGWLILRWDRPGGELEVEFVPTPGLTQREDICTRRSERQPAALLVVAQPGHAPARSSRMMRTAGPPPSWHLVQA